MQRSHIQGRERAWAWAVMIPKLERSMPQITTSGRDMLNI